MVLLQIVNGPKLLQSSFSYHGTTNLLEQCHLAYCQDINFHHSLLLSCVLYSYINILGYFALLICLISNGFPYFIWQPNDMASVHDCVSIIQWSARFPLRRKLHLLCPVVLLPGAAWKPPSSHWRLVNSELWDGLSRPVISHGDAIQLLLHSHRKASSLVWYPKAFHHLVPLERKASLQKHTSHTNKKRLFPLPPVKKGYTAIGCWVVCTASQTGK